MAIRVPAAEGDRFQPGQRSLAYFDTPREITIDDPESLASALALTESEIDVLHDPFAEHSSVVYRTRIGRAKVNTRRPDDSYELL